MREHIVVDLRDEAAVLEDRNEPSGRDESNLIRDPSDKGFRAELLICARIVLGLVIDLEFLFFERVLLMLSNKIDPLLVFNELVAKESDTGIIRGFQCHACSGSVVVEKIDIGIFPDVGRDHVNACLELEVVLRADSFKALYDAFELGPCFFLASCLKKDLEVIDRAVRADLVLFEETADVLPDLTQRLLTLVNGMAEDVVAVSDEYEAYDSVIDAGLSLLQDLLALHCKPEPVAVYRDVVS